MDADSKYIPTKEKTNFVRLIALLTDICTDILRDVFDKRIPSTNLASVLSSQKSALFALKILNYEQRQLLYPQPSGTPFKGSSRDMDLSLLYLLLRSICCIPGHINGWGKPPASGDDSLAANIEWIRIERNEIQGHVKKAVIDDAEFEKHWKIIFDAVKSIEINFLGGGTKYQDSIDMMYSTDFNPEMEKFYLDEIKKSHDREMQNRELIEKVNNQLISTNMGVVTIESRLSGVQVDVNKMRHEQGSLKRTGKSLVDAQRKTERQMKFASQRFSEMKNDLAKEQQNMFENTQKTVIAAMSDIKRQMEEKSNELSRMEKLLVKVTADDGVNQDIKDDIGEVKKNIAELKVGICSMEKQYCDISVQLQQIQGDKELPEDKELKRIIDYSVEVIKQYDEQKDIVQTGAMGYMMDRLNGFCEQCAVITGYVGQGKSTLAKEGVSQLSKHSVTTTRVPVVITRPDQWSVVARSKTPMIVFIDDIFGKTNFDLSTMTIWSPLFNDMQIAITSGKVILIMTMRKHIFEDAKLHLLEYTLFQEKYIVDLTSENLQLTSLERKNILIAHIQSPESKAILSDEENLDEDDNGKVPISMSSLEKIIEKSTKLSQDLGYPQCCRMFVSNKTYLKQGVLFFENPVEFLKSYLDKLYSIDKMAYFTLCYTLFSDNQLYLEDMHVMPDRTQNNARFHDIALICCIPQSSIWDLLIAIPEKVKAMNGSFFKFNKMDGYYELSHRSVSDALCWSFGKLSSRKLVEHCPLTFLCENVRTRYCPRGSEEITLEIVPRYYYDLARRITNEILSGNVLEVAKHVVLQDGEFVKVLVEFWIEMGNFSKILDQKNTFSNDVSLFTLVAMIPGGELLKQIVRSGELEKLEDESASDKMKAEALRQVCSVKGDFEVYSVLVAWSAPITPECLTNAVTADCFEIVVDLLNRFPWRPVDLSKARMSAMLKGHLRSYKSLVNYDTVSLCFEDLMTAVETDSEEFVSHLLQSKIWVPHYLSSALEKACETGHFKIFNLLLQSDAPVSEHCLGYAAEHSDNKILSVLLKSKPWPDKEKGIAFARAVCKNESYKTDEEDSTIETLLQAASLSENALGEALLEMVRLQNAAQAEVFIDKFPAVVNYIDSRLESPLHHAMASYVSLDVVDLLLRKGVDIHLGNIVGRTALHFAASFGQTDVAEIFISQGADVNVKDEVLVTPLHCAAKAGKQEVAKLLLENGADVNAENRWHTTPLCELDLATDGLDFAVLLGSKGAKINSYNLKFSSESLLFHCLKIGSLELLKEFLEKGEVEKQDINKALLRICQKDHGNFEMYKCLLDFNGVPSAGCLMESVFNEFDDICLDLLDRKSDWSEKELCRSLQFACKNGNKQVYEKLLESGAVVELSCMLEVKGHIDIFTDILSRRAWSDYQLGVVMADTEFRDEYRDIVFESIIRASSSASSVIGECLCEAVRNSNISTADLMVVKYNADINFVNGAKSSPLHIAAEMGDEEMVEYLLGKGAETQVKDGGGKTPFLISCGTSVLSNVEILYKHSAKAKDMTDVLGRNGLHYAAKSGTRMVFNFLLLNGFNRNCKNLNDQTLLHSAADTGNMAVFDLLTVRDVDIDIADRQGQTPLHLAMKGDNTDFAVNLFKIGAGIDKMDSSGKSPFHLASDRLQRKVVECILEDVKVHHIGSVDKLIFLSDNGFVNVIRTVIGTKPNVSVLEESMFNSCETIPIFCPVNQSFKMAASLLNSVDHSCQVDGEVKEISQSMVDSYNTVPTSCSMIESINMAESRNESYPSLLNGVESTCPEFLIDSDNKEMKQSMADSYKTVPSECDMNQSINMAESNPSILNRVERSHETVPEDTKDKVLEESMTTFYKTVNNVFGKNTTRNMEESNNDFCTSFLDNTESSFLTIPEVSKDQDLEESVSSSTKSLPSVHVCDIKKNSNMEESRNDFCTSFMNNTESSFLAIPEVSKDQDVEESVSSSTKSLPSVYACDTNKSSNMEESRNDFCSSFMNNTESSFLVMPELNKDWDLEERRTTSYKNFPRVCGVKQTTNMEESRNDFCTSFLNDTEWPYSAVNRNSLASSFDCNQEAPNMSVDRPDLNLNIHTQQQTNTSVQENVMINSLSPCDDIYRNQSVDRSLEASVMTDSFSPFDRYQVTSISQSYISTTSEYGQCRNDELNKGILHACKSGNYDFYDVMLDLGANIVDGCLTLAIQSNCSDLINDLLIQRQDWNSEDLESAKGFIIQSGNKAWFEKLFNSGAELDSRCLLLTVGNVDMLKLMLTKQWDKSQMAVALVRSWPSDSSPLPSYDCILNEVIQKGWLNECLFFAVCFESEHIVMKLIELNVNINGRNDDGYTAIHFALQQKREIMFNILVQHGASLEVLYKDVPLLDWALTNCSSKMFRCLVSKLIHGHIKKKDFGAILFTAVKSKCHEAVKILIEAGIPIDICDEKGRMPIHHAALADDMLTIDFLLKNGAMIDDRDYEDCTPLHLVAQQGLVDTVVSLVDRGAFVDDTNSSGRSPLHIAVDGHKMSTANKLIEVNACVNCVDSNGKNALHTAVINNDLEMSKLLLEYKADVHHKDWNQRIPLHYAVLSGNLQNVKLCVKYGFNKASNIVDQENLNCLDEQKWTPLHYAVENGDIEVMKILLKYGASVDIKDKRGKRPVHLASKHKDVSIMELLFLHGAIVDVRDDNNETPLHLAVKENNIVNVTFLLQKGANALLVNRMGKTPLDLAKNGKPEMHGVFKKHFGGSSTCHSNGGKNECNIM